MEQKTEPKQQNVISFLFNYKMAHISDAFIHLFQTENQKEKKEMERKQYFNSISKNRFTTITK